MYDEYTEKCLSRLDGIRQQRREAYEAWVAECEEQDLREMVDDMASSMEIWNRPQVDLSTVNLEEDDTVGLDEVLSDRCACGNEIGEGGIPEFKVCKECR